MTATPVRRDHETRAADWYGWKPSRAHPCPLSLAGHRCRLHTALTCLCNTRRLLDHPRRWTDRDGNPVLTAEPYDAHGEEVAELVAELAALGLRVRLSGRSPYNPTRTLLLVIGREADVAS